MIRVSVEAKDAIAQAGLESIIRSQANFQVVDRFSTLQNAPSSDRQPDILLLEWLEIDPQYKDKFSFDATFSPAVVVLIDIPDRERLLQILSFGARGILPRAATAQEIVAAIAAVAAGLLVFAPDFLESWLDIASFRVSSYPSEPVEALTQRELEVLQMLAQGLGNKAIATGLGISEHTVKFHISSIFTKLNVSSRTEAVTQGLRQGLILL
jgi:two-component system, NarL family, response regulator YdfI